MESWEKRINDRVSRAYDDIDHASEFTFSKLKKQAKEKKKLEAAHPPKQGIREVQALSPIF